MARTEGVGLEGRLDPVLALSLTMVEPGTDNSPSFSHQSQGDYLGWLPESPPALTILCSLNNYKALSVDVFCQQILSQQILTNTFCVPVGGSEENAVGIADQGKPKQAKSLALQV